MDGRDISWIIQTLVGVQAVYGTPFLLPPSTVKWVTGLGKYRDVPASDARPTLATHSSLTSWRAGECFGQFGVVCTCAVFGPRWRPEYGLRTMRNGASTCQYYTSLGFPVIIIGSRRHLGSFLAVPALKLRTTRKIISSWALTVGKTSVSTG